MTKIFFAVLLAFNVAISSRVIPHSGNAEMAEAKKPSLAKKLAEIKSHVSRVAKNGYNEYHKYPYVLESDLLDVLGPRLAEANIMIWPHVDEYKKLGDVTFLMVTFKFEDGDSGETREVRIAGEGQDKGDKGVYKALTGATKYMLMKTFLVATGDDPEDEQGGEAKPKEKRKAGRPKKSEKQAEGTASESTLTTKEQVAFLANELKHDTAFRENATGVLRDYVARVGGKKTIKDVPSKTACNIIDDLYVIMKANDRDKLIATVKLVMLDNQPSESGSPSKDEVFNG